MLYIPIVLKRCANCEHYLLHSEFYRRKASKDGLAPICTRCSHIKTCTYYQTHKDQVDERNRQYAKDHPDLIAKTKKRYVHNHPDRRKESAAKYRDAHRIECNERIAQWAKRNRRRRAEQARQYYQRHPVQCRQRSRKYARENAEMLRLKRKRYNKTLNGSLSNRSNAHRRRALKLQNGGSHTAEDIKIQHARQKGRCYWCDKKVGKKYHVDHVIPLTRGGTNDPSNLVIACPECNLSKNNKLPHEWDGNGGRMF